MRHSISLTCVRYRLRPVTLDDAPFIVALRTDPLLNRFVHEISPRVEDQIVWLERYFFRPDDYYFIVEDADSGEPHGAIGIYECGKGCGAMGPLDSQARFHGSTGKCMAHPRGWVFEAAACHLVVPNAGG